MSIANVITGGIGPEATANYLITKGFLPIFVTGTSSVQTLPSLNQSGVGVESFVANSSQVLGALTQAGIASALLAVTGTGVAILSPATQAGVGAQEFTGAGLQTLAAAV